MDGGWRDMNIQLCLVPPLLSNAGPGSHRGEGLSMQSSRMAAWQPRYCPALYTSILIIRHKWTRNKTFNKLLWISVFPSILACLGCLDKSRNKTKCQIFYKNLIELSPGQRGVDLIIGLCSSPVPVHVANIIYKIIDTNIVTIFYLYLFRVLV